MLSLLCFLYVFISGLTRSWFISVVSGGSSQNTLGGGGPPSAEWGGGRL